MPGKIELAEIGQTFGCDFADQLDKSADARIAYVDYSALGKDLVVRSKLPGDRFVPLGVKGTKKVQDFFVDEKIPAEQRDNVPLVESGGRIVWVGGLRLDDRAKVTEKTKKIVRLELAK